MKRCHVCSVEKPRREFPSGRSTCKACVRARDRQRYRAVADRSRQWIDDYARRWRSKAGNVVASANRFVERTGGQDGPPHYYFRAQHAAIVAYGGYRCACCGETEPMFLTIDHINSDGKRQRRQLGAGSNKFYDWLRANNYPPGYQVLCSNCNFGRYRNGGICPHARHRDRKSAAHAITPLRPAKRAILRMMNSLGQVRVPKKLRTQLGLNAGDAIEFETRLDGRVTLIRAEDQHAARRAGAKGGKGN